MHTNSHELSAGYGEAPSPGRRGDRSPEAFEFVFIRVNSWLKWVHDPECLLIFNQI